MGASVPIPRRINILSTNEVMDFSPKIPFMQQPSFFSKLYYQYILYIFFLSMFLHYSSVITSLIIRYLIGRIKNFFKTKVYFHVKHYNFYRNNKDLKAKQKRYEIRETCTNLYIKYN